MQDKSQLQALFNEYNNSFQELLSNMEYQEHPELLNEAISVLENNLKKVKKIISSENSQQNSDINKTKKVLSSEKYKQDLQILCDKYHLPYDKLYNLLRYNSKNIQENNELKNILDKTYKQIFEEYLNSKEFKIDEINRLKKNKMDNEYIKKYKYLAKHIIEFYSE